jgi:manganese/zinc/iron transport system substrate-binding protein
MGDIFEQMSGSKPTVAVADGIPEELYITNVSFPGAHDPHIWFDVDLWVMVVQYVAESLAEFDPDHTDEYFANAEAYESELHELDTYVTNRALELDDSSRVLITAHDAFGYFGQAYSFEVRGLQGISTATEAGTADVSSLADFITERQIPAIFVESSVSPRTIEAVQAAVESRGYNVEIGGQLFSDAMGEPGTFEGTYIGMVTYNIDTIVDSLSR